MSVASFRPTMKSDRRPDARNAFFAVCFRGDSLGTGTQSRATTRFDVAIRRKCPERLHGLSWQRVVEEARRGWDRRGGVDGGGGRGITRLARGTRRRRASRASAVQGASRRLACPAAMEKKRTRKRASRVRWIIIVACGSTPRAAYRPTADDRRRAIARARRIHRRAGTGTARASRTGAARDARGRWVGGWARKITAMLHLERSRHGARARLGFRGPGSSRGGGETRNRRPESASTYLDVLHVPGGPRVAQ